MHMQFEIQFVGDKFAAVSVLTKYFGNDAVVYDDQFTICDSNMRIWSVTVKSDNNPFDTIVTPMLDMNDANDVVLMHDVLLLMRMSDSIATNDKCAMRINISAPVDKRKLSLYFEEYVQCQYDQVNAFDTTVSGPLGDAKLYKYDVCGYELDNVNDILLVIMANYASPCDSDLSFASGFALNFTKVMTDDQLQFRAFNGTFDDDYVLSAARWVQDFIEHCNETWSNGWRQEFERLRQVYTSI